jgi:hypothetical protein
VPAHLERAGPFNPNGNNGFNVEHLRNFNNAAPRVAFGFETQPGHGASSDRGEYSPRRNNIGGVLVDSVGGTTYGGTGVYGAYVGGVWDALLGEGRGFWFFASSDWHNRGIFGPDDRRTTQDFYPGEYQRDFVMVRNGKDKKLRPQDDRRRAAQRQQLHDQRPADRPPCLRRLRVVSDGQSASHTTAPVTGLATRQRSATPTSIARTARRWARSWSSGRAPRSSSRSSSATRPEPTTRRTRSPTRRWPRSASVNRSTRRCSTILT